MQASLNELEQTFRPLTELVPTHWQNSFVDTTDGARLHYTRTGGAKPTLVLLHGVQGTGLMWLRTAQALEAEYDVVLPDFRGHGTSSPIERELSVELLVADTVALMEALKLEQPYVVGHSMGADIAGRLAATEALRALVLVDPALRNFAASMSFDPDNPPPWMAAVFETMRALRTQSHVERLHNGRRLLPPGTPPWAEADYVTFVDAMAQFDPSVYRYTPRMGYLFEAPEVIARITCPVLLLTARSMMPGGDGTVDVSVWQRNVHALEHVHFADSGHFIMFDQFDRFVATLRRFLHEH